MIVNVSFVLISYTDVIIYSTYTPFSVPDWMLNVRNVVVSKCKYSSCSHDVGGLVGEVEVNDHIQGIKHSSQYKCFKKNNLALESAVTLVNVLYVLIHLFFPITP